MQFHEQDVQEQLNERAKRQRLWPAGRYIIRATTQAYGFYPVADWVPFDDHGLRWCNLRHLSPWSPTGYPTSTAMASQDGPDTRSAASATII